MNGTDYVHSFKPRCFEVFAFLELKKFPCARYKTRLENR